MPADEKQSSARSEQRRSPRVRHRGFRSEERVVVDRMMQLGIEHWTRSLCIEPSTLAQRSELRTFGDPQR